MQKPLPNRLEVNRHAKLLRHSIAKCSEVLGRNYERPGDRKGIQEIRGILELIASEGGKQSLQSWDAVAHVYLATFAAHAASVEAHRAGGRIAKPVDQKIDELLESIRKKLLFHPDGDYDSPKGFSHDSAKSINDELRQIRELWDSSRVVR